MRRLAISLSSLICCFVLMSHEFWLEPANFRITPGETLTLNFRVGENFVGASWKAFPERFERLELYNGGKVADLRDYLGNGENGAISFAVPEEGTAVVVMRSTHSVSKMEAEEFNAYLKEDGLDDAYAQRKKSNTLDQPATERYSRCAKMILQSGERTTETFSKVAELPLEIVPLQNPYTLKIGERLRFRVLLQGKPLFGAKVKVWNQYQRQTSVQNIYSQQDGTIETTLSNPGAWMVSVVHMIPCKQPEADWESFWSTLTFGIGARR